ncbi:unnamed protein product [Chrysoparadoxa australica]
MVQFGLQMENNVVAKWSKHYLDYASLKKEIKKRIKAGLREVAPQRGRARSQTPGSTLRSLADSAETDLLLKRDRASYASLSKSSTDIEEDLAFETIFLAEVNKVNNFFKKMVSIFALHLNDMLETEKNSSRRKTLGGMDSIAAIGSGSDSDGGDGGDYRLERTESVMVSQKEIESLGRAMRELFRDLTLLRNFAILNYTGCIKIAKKHDKKLARRTATHAALSEPIMDKMMKHIHMQDFYLCRKLNKLIERCEREYATLFCQGDVNQARGLLLPQKLDERVEWAQLALGYHMGMAAVLALWVLWDCCVEVHRVGEDVSVIASPAFIVYRCLAGVLLLHWCWCILTSIWSRARINYIYLFELDPRYAVAPIQLANDAAVSTSLFFANMLLYYKIVSGRLPGVIPAGVFPLSLVIYFAKTSLFPYKRKHELWDVLRDVLGAPFTVVNFFSVFAADFLTSSVKTLLDLSWTLGFFFSGDFLLSVYDFHNRRAPFEKTFWYRQVISPVLSILPLWLRFQQCLRRYSDTKKRCPNLPNALKYAMAQTVAIFAVLTDLTAEMNAAKLVWIILYVVSSLYSWSWDVIQDWGISPSRLEKRRMYSKKWFYYVAIVVDMVLRFNWLYSFIPPGKSFLAKTLPLYVSTIVLLLELGRRTMWGLFRLENEYLANTEGYRRIEAIPMHFHSSKKKGTEEVVDTQTGWQVLVEALSMFLAAIAITVLAIIIAKNE